MKFNFKEKKGITLIALVITIIVLLILAGVTIATLTGENGILTKAQSAKKLSNKAEVEEKIDLAVQASRINTEGKIDSQKLKEELEKQGLTVENITDETTGNLVAYKVSANGYIYKVDITTGVKEQITGVIIEAPENTNIFVEETINLTAKLVDMQGTITWESSNENVVVEATAENDKQATVTVNGGATGTVTITAKLDEEHKAICELKVFSKVESITVDNETLEIEQGETAELVATPMTKPTNINVEDLVFSSNNEKVTVGPKGTVNEDGSVTTTISVASDATIETNVATITVQGEKTGNVEGKIATCTVTVIKPEVLGVGSYVDYGVSYTDVYSTTKVYDNSTKETCGWRILKLGNYNESTRTYSNSSIISTGIPAKLDYHFRTGDDGEKINSGNKPSWWGTSEQVAQLYGGNISRAGYVYDKGGYPNYFAATGLNKNFESIQFEENPSAYTYGKGGYIDIKNKSYTSENVTGKIFRTDQAEEVHNITMEELDMAKRNGLCLLSNTYWVSAPQEPGYEDTEDAGRISVVNACYYAREDRLIIQDTFRGHVYRWGECFWGYSCNYFKRWSFNNKRKKWSMARKIT